MAFGKTLLTAGILIVAGFSGGFLLSKGSGQILGMKPPHKPSTRLASNANEVAALAILKAADPDGEGAQSGHHPALGQGGAGEDEAAEAGPGAGVGSGGPEGAGTDGAEAKAGMDASADAGSDTAGGPPRSSTKTQTLELAGTEAATFLVGNTVDASLSKEAPHLTVYIARGLRADGREGSFVVKPWTPKATSLCEPGPDGALICQPLRVRADASVHATGDRIGFVLVAGNRWVPIYKGDKLDVPNHIPFIDSTVADPEPSTIPPKATSKGQSALDALIGHAASIDQPDRDTGQPVGVVYYGADGRRVTLVRPDVAADLSDGLAIAVGRWSFSKGIFCQSDGTLGAVQACSKPEAWGKTIVRLVPMQKTPMIQLDILAESPKAHLEATN